MTDESGRYLAFPFRVGKDGRTASTRSLEDHVRDEIVQLVLTNPGERALLPEFGGGARRLVFGDAIESTSGLAKALITQSISTWLGRRATIEGLTVEVTGETIDIELHYRVENNDEIKVIKFQRSGV